MRLDADDDSVKGRFGVATWKAAFCDCGETQRRGDAGRGMAHNGLSARIMFSISNVGVCHRF